MATEIIETPQWTPAALPETPHAAVTLFGTDDPAAVVERAVATSKALMAVVRSQKLSVPVQGKDYLLVEAWTMLGSLVGVFPVTEWSRPIREGNRTLGWEARVVAHTRDGAIVGAAEAMCMRDESTTRRDGQKSQRWINADEHAIRSMAQTRATSKALAMPLRFIAVLAGFAGTPYEEMPKHEATAKPSKAAQAKPAAATVELLPHEGEPCLLCSDLGWMTATQQQPVFRRAKDGKLLFCNGKRENGDFAAHEPDGQDIPF